MLDSATRTHGTRQTARRRLRAVAAAVLVAVTAAGTLVLVGSTPASASTLNGIATIASPGRDHPADLGRVDHALHRVLPAQAACDGDTATDGYHVYSYLVPEGTDLWV